MNLYNGRLVLCLKIPMGQGPKSYFTCFGAEGWELQSQLITLSMLYFLSIEKGTKVKITTIAFFLNITVQWKVHPQGYAQGLYLSKPLLCKQKYKKALVFLL